MLFELIFLEIQMIYEQFFKFSNHCRRVIFGTFWVFIERNTVFDWKSMFEESQYLKS